MTERAAGAALSFRYRSGARELVLPGDQAASAFHLRCGTTRTWLRAELAPERLLAFVAAVDNNSAKEAA
jgi:hypothetical protein